MFKQILKKIKEYDTIIIHGHQRPDGDCYGSQFGLQRILKENFKNKKVYVVGGLCEYCSFLGQMDQIEDSVYENALAIVVDCGNSERISDQRYKTAKYVIKIDHHIADNHYGDLAYVEEEAPACTQIIYDFAAKMKLRIPYDAAFALYVGLVTDTGRFRFDSVVGHTMEVAGHLLDLGVSPDKVDNYLSVESLDTLKLKGYVLSNFETKPGFVYIKMTRDIVEKFGVSDEEAANQVSTLAGIEGYPVWALFMEYPDNEIRVRLRSRGPDINKLAEKYEGGGHAKAAGAKLAKWEDLDQFANEASEISMAFQGK